MGGPNPNPTAASDRYAIIETVEASLIRRKSQPLAAYCMQRPCAHS